MYNFIHGEGKHTRLALIALVQICLKMWQSRFV